MVRCCSVLLGKAGCGLVWMEWLGWYRVFGSCTLAPGAVAYGGVRYGTDGLVGWIVVLYGGALWGSVPSGVVEFVLARMVWTRFRTVGLGTVSYGFVGLGPD